jgi:hypothetical protein
VRDGDWDSFAQQVLGLLSDAEPWAVTSAAGIELTRREFSPDVLRERFRQVLGRARR